MKRISPAWSRLAMALLVPVWLLAVPATALSAQARGRSHTPSGGGGGHASGGGGSAPSGGGTAVPRGDRSGSSGTGSANKGATGDHAVVRGTSAGDSPESAAPPRSHPRDGNTAVGQAVPRSSAPPTSGGRIVAPGRYYGGYYPWGFGGLGLGGYYGGYYDPYGGYYDPYGGYQGYPQSSYTFGYEGKLRLKVKPREASVHVDGYYVGIVDNFDGVFQRLHLESGPHRIEISAPGYEPLMFDIRIEPDQTLTYHGELRKIP